MVEFASAALETVPHVGTAPTPPEMSTLFTTTSERLPQVLEAVPYKRSPVVTEETPVPPFIAPKTPDIAFNEGEVVADTTPLVAWRKPVREDARVVVPEMFNVPVIVPLPLTCKPVELAVPTTSSLVFGLNVPIPTLPLLNIAIVVVPPMPAVPNSIFPPVVKRLMSPATEPVR